MGRFIAAFLPLIFAQFPSSKIADDVTNGLAINLTVLSNGQINIESMFQEKADFSWLPNGGYRKEFENTVAKVAKSLSKSENRTKSSKFRTF